MVQYCVPEIRSVLDFLGQILIHNQLVGIFVPQSKIGGGSWDSEISAELSDDIIDGECGQLECGR